LRARDRKITDRQLASANAALTASAVGPKRSFRRTAVTKGRTGNPRGMRLEWLARAAFILEGVDEPAKFNRAMAELVRPVIGV
jgi:hypothetical protein